MDKNKALYPLRYAISEMASWQVISHDESETLSSVIDVFATDIVDIDAALNDDATYVAVAGFFYQRTKKVLEDEQTKLEKAFGQIYNSVRRAKYNEDGKAPKERGLGGNWSNELVRARAFEQPAYVEQLQKVNAIKYFAELLKELRSALAIRSRSIEHLSNNLRAQGRLDTT